MNRPVFRSAELRRRFDEEGFAVFPLLTPEEIEYCIRLYNSVSDELPFQSGIHITFQHSLPAQHRHISSQICGILGESLQRVLSEFEFFNGSFVVKSGNREDSVVELHQDWSFVREDKGFRSGTLWAPLVDTSHDNGAIGFIPRSHKWTTAPRFAPRGYSAPEWFDHRELLMGYVDMIPMAAGDGVIWDHGLFHASFPNLTNQPRLVISSVVTGPGADPCFLVVESDSNPQVYNIIDVETSFFEEQTIRTMQESYAATGAIGGGTLSEVRPIIRSPGLSRPDILALLSGSGLTAPNPETMQYIEKQSLRPTPAIEPRDQHPRVNVANSAEVVG